MDGESDVGTLNRLAGISDSCFLNVVRPRLLGKFGPSLLKASGLQILRGWVCYRLRELGQQAESKLEASSPFRPVGALSQFHFGGFMGESIFLPFPAAGGHLCPLTIPCVREDVE